MASKQLTLYIIGSLVALHYANGAVTYDRRGLIINGQRRMLFSGSIHYPRSTPEVAYCFLLCSSSRQGVLQMWGGLIQKAKDGGIDVIDTYVFWNGHEPSPGKYNFEGRYDLIRFLKLVHQAGLYANVRIGPYICAEWNFGGFPVWLKFVPGVSFRTDNGPFKAAMQSFTQRIVQMMKSERLFEPQGGPIILSQIENEYEEEERLYGNAGRSYMNWAAGLAVSLNIGVPWVMCKESDAPDPIINSCNGFYCDYFSSNKAYKPTIWTEAWTGWFDLFGGPSHKRPVEDLAFAVARFVQKGGSFVNYYMYHGGTNFGRTAGGPFVATSYDYDAPIDEYGLIREPKHGHLRDLSAAVKSCERVLMTADAAASTLGRRQQGHVFSSSAGCVAFLSNYDFYNSATVRFRGTSYNLPPWSISILPDCKSVAFNTANVRVRSSTAHMVATPAQIRLSSVFNEPIGSFANSMVGFGLLDQVSVTRDTSDYLWYSTSVYISPWESCIRDGKSLSLSVQSAGDALQVYINGAFYGSSHGSHESPRFTFYGNVRMRAGRNDISILSIAVGLSNNGPHYEAHRKGVVGPVALYGLDRGGLDLTSRRWAYRAGLRGESVRIQSQMRFGRASQPLTWYRGYFDSPGGNEPVALDMSGMGKGQIWVNGNHIGRFWSLRAYGKCSSCGYAGTYRPFKCETGCGFATQKWYHVPRSWLKPTGNSLLIFDETGVGANAIPLLTRIVLY